MNRRLTGLAAAGVFALVGTTILIGYVRSAEARALEGEKIVDVLVVHEAVAAGTPAEDLADAVETEQVPAKVLAENAVTDLDDVEGLVTTVDLVPGEQLVLDRFGEAVAREGVPEGLLEVTVRLDPERALGGQLRAGDHVAVISSFEPFEIAAAGTSPGTNASEKTPNTTHVILHKVLVTNVQVSEAIEKTDEDDDLPDVGPTGTLLVTLALDAESVQRVVFTAEHGTLWLSAEPTNAPESELIIETRGSVDR